MQTELPERGPADILIEKVNKGDLLVHQANWEDVFVSAININYILANRHCYSSWQELLHMLLCEIDNFDYRIDALNYMINYGAQWFNKRGLSQEEYVKFSKGCLCLIYFYHQLKDIIINNEELRIYLKGNKIKEDYFKYEFEIVMSNISPEDLVAFSQAIGYLYAKNNKFPNLIDALLIINNFKGKIVAKNSIAFFKILYELLNMIAFYEKYHDMPEQTPIKDEILVGFRNISLSKRLRCFQTYWEILCKKKGNELMSNVERYNLPTEEEISYSIYQSNLDDWQHALEESKDPNNKDWQFKGAPDVLKMYEYFVQFAYDKYRSVPSVKEKQDRAIAQVEMQIALSKQTLLQDNSPRQIIFNGDNTIYNDIHDNNNPIIH